MPSRLNLLGTGGKFPNKNLPGGDLVTTTDSNRIIISLYLWLLFYSIKSSDVFFEGAISIFCPSEEILSKKYLPVACGILSVHLVPENDTQFSLLVFHISKSTKYLR